MGLREDKKLKTRKLISDQARDLFIERGFDAVTVAEIAEKSQVAVATLFNYFPTKESIIFDREDELDQAMVEAVRGRKKDQSVLDVLHKHFLSSKLIDPPNKKIHADFMKLVRSSPELSLHFRGIWDRYGKTLSKEIQTASGVGKAEADGLSWLILEAVNFACHSPAPKEALNFSFKILKNGWSK